MQATSANRKGSAIADPFLFTVIRLGGPRRGLDRGHVSVALVIGTALALLGAKGDVVLASDRTYGEDFETDDFSVDLLGETHARVQLFDKQWTS